MTEISTRSKTHLFTNAKIRLTDIPRIQLARESEHPSITVAMRTMIGILVTEALDARDAMNSGHTAINSVE